MASSSCSKFEPAATKYKFIPITTLLNHRQMGFSRSRFKNQFIRSTENSTADMGILCSLYCDANAYLEVIACRKVPRAQAAAFFHGRLFVENYQSWYNLCTSPTSGPVLMTENIFAGSRGGTSSAAAPATASQSSQSRLTQTPEGKVIDAVCVDHPYDCKAPPDRMWYGAQLFLLTKTGCLYQADIETARILDQIHLPTKQYEDQLFDVSEKLSSDVESSLRDIEIRKPPKFNYNYIAVNRENESVIIKSSRHHNSHANLSSTAYCVLKLYPLSVHCHFTVEVATTCTTPPFSADVIEDFFVVTANKQSKISFYSLEDVIGEYGFSRHVRLKEKVKVFYSREWPHFTEAVVGAKQLGVPYTMRPVRLDRVTRQCRLLFKTVAVKHSLQIGSSPYHYMVAMNRNGTAWGLRHIADQADAHAVKLQVAEKWDGSQWNGVRFHNDDTGRIFKQDSNSLEVFSVVNNPPSSADMPGDGKSGARHNSLVSLRSDFKIDITPPCGDLSAQLDDDSGGGAQKWECSVPPMAPYAVSSRGRPVRRPRPWYGAAYHGGELGESRDDCHLLVCVEYDHDLNLLGLLYYRPKTVPVSPGWEEEEEGARLVLALHDNFSGAKLTEFALEDDCSPSDRDYLWLSIDHDTIIYTRLRFNDNRVQYTVLRLHRRFGGLHVTGS